MGLRLLGVAHALPRLHACRDGAAAAGLIPAEGDHERDHHDTHEAGREREHAPAREHAAGATDWRAKRSSCFSCSSSCGLRPGFAAAPPHRQARTASQPSGAGLYDRRSMADEPVNDVIVGDGYAVANIDGIGDGYGFRKIRRELG